MPAVDGGLRAEQSGRRDRAEDTEYVRLGTHRAERVRLTDLPAEPAGLARERDRLVEPVGERRERGPPGQRGPPGAGVTQRLVPVADRGQLPQAGRVPDLDEYRRPQAARLGVQFGVAGPLGER